MGAPSTQKSRALMVYLAMRHGTNVPRERVLETFWPDSDPHHARQSLKTATWAIRRVLRLAGCEPDRFLASGKRELQWVAPTDVDVNELVALAERDDPAALERWTGAFLDGDDEEWTVAQRERIDACFDRYLERRLAATRDPAVAERLIVRNPYAEEAYEILIGAELAAGRRIAAGLLLQRARSALSELGIEPSATLRGYSRALDDRAMARTSRVVVPFVGRERERTRIERRCATMELGAGSVTLLHGDAGIGKSTLLRELQLTASEAGRRVIGVRALRSDPRSFGVWSDLFAQLVGAPLEQRLSGGVAIDADEIAQAILEAIGAPVLLLVDDAHAFHGDAGSVLVALAARGQAAGFTVVLATRPEGVVPLRDALALGVEDDIELGPLLRSEVRAAVRATLVSDDRAVADRLYERTAGHPLWFVGLLSAALASGDTGALMQADGIGAVPDEVRRFVAARVRDAGPLGMRVACALALEPDANSEDIAGALALPADDVFDALDELLALGILREPRSGRSFAFAHDLYAEVSATLEHSGRRVQLHTRFADLIAASGGPNTAVRRARHLAAAGRAAGAADAYADAATEALEWFAWRDALTRCEAGLAVLRSVTARAPVEASRARLRILEARAQAAHGDDAGAVAPIEAAVIHARAAGNDTLEFTAQRIRAAVLVQTRIPDRAWEAAREADAIARRLGDDAMMATANTMLGAAGVLRGDEPAALQAVSMAISSAMATGKADAIVTHACHAARVRLYWWDLTGSAEALEVARGCVAEAGWIGTAEHALTAALDAYHRGLYAEASGLARIAVSAADDTGERAWRPNSAAVDRLKLRFHPALILAAAAAARALWDDAADAARALLASPLCAFSVHHRNNVLHVLIDALLGRDRSGDRVEAEAFAAQLVPNDREGAALYDAGWSVAVTRARLVAGRDEPDAARAIEHAVASFGERAARCPLDAERTYGHLAATAASAGLPLLAAHCHAEKVAFARRHAARMKAPQTK